MTQNRAWRRHVYSPLFDETHVAGTFIIYGASNIPEKRFHFVTTLRFSWNIVFLFLAENQLQSRQLNFEAQTLWLYDEYVVNR